MKDSDLYPTDEDTCTGLNPCGEITLQSYENCNLVELFLNNIETPDELFDCAKLLYKTQKAISALPFLYEETNKVVHKNMRLGVGVTGICQSMHKLDWLDECYVKLREFDTKWSAIKGYPRSIKLTTVKPSGSVSLLGGATPGVHPAYSKYYIRRIRMSSDDKLVQICRDAGYNVEYQVRFDGTDDYSTSIIEFPCETPPNAITAADMSIEAQLEMVKVLQYIWSDNAVSVTAYYKPEELNIIKDWMKARYENNIKSISFLLHSKHGFNQAPYEEIDEKTYQRLIKKIKPLTSIASLSTKVIEGLECEGGSCPIR